MSTIESEDYEVTRQRMMKDPIVIAMAEGLFNTTVKDITHPGPEKTPRFEFMMMANKEYRRRGGTDGGHIGAVAEALIRLVDA